MASWTDQTPQFNQYISQLPVQAMVDVGMQLQNRYNEGVQKIQQQIDNVAGIDVIKPIHKEYLQSKLNELGSKLKTVAAGDFSNYQLVNSVGGMVNQIGKDPIIQNAAYSTQLVRNGQRQLDEAKKAGKASPQNEAYWNKQLDEWINDNNAKSQFSGSYIPYTDVESKLRQLVKDIPEIESTADIPFKRDSSGNVMFNPSTGRPILDDAIMRTTVKGKSAQKILDNFMMSLDENDIRQLNIDGWYHYKDATKQSLQSDIHKSYDEAKTRTSNEIARLTVELKNNPNLTKVEKFQTESQINQLSTLLNNGSLEAKRDQDLRQIDSLGVEQYKQKLYTEKFLGGLADAMAYQSTKTTYETNPYKQVELEKAKLQFQINKAAQEHNEFMMKYQLDLGKLMSEKQEKSKKELQERFGIPTDLPISTNVPKATMAEQLKTVTSLNEQLTNFRNEQGPIVFGRDKWNNLKSESEREKLFEDYINQNNTNPSSKLSPVDQAIMDTYRNLQNQWTDEANKFTTVFEKSKPFEASINNVIKNKQPLVIPTQYGDLTFFPSDVHTVLQAKEQFTKKGSTRTPGSIGGIQEDKFDTQGFLSKFKGTHLEPIANALSGEVKPLSQITPIDREIYNYANLLNRDIKSDPTISKLMSDKLDFEANELAKLSPNLQEKFSTINMENKDNQFIVSNIFNAENLNSLRRESQNENTDFDTITKWQKDKQPLQYVVKKNPDGSGDILVGKGTEWIPVHMSPEIFQSNLPELAYKSPAQDVVEKVQLSDNKTTNTMGIVGSDTGGPSARYSANDFPTLLKNTPLANIVKFDIEGSRITGLEGYQIRMYVYDDKEKIWKSDLLNSNLLSADQIYPKLSEVGKNTVNDILSQK